MTRKTIPKIIVLCSILFLVLGCRTTDETITNEKPKYFKVFGEKDDLSLNYSKGFKLIFENYDSIQKTKKKEFKPITETFFKKNSATQKNNGSENEYVDFRYHSQTFKWQNGEVWVYFPVIKNNQVSKIVAGVLSESRTKVSLKLLNPNIDYYLTVYNLFKEAYIKSHTKQISNNFTAKYATTCEVGCTNIEEVVITVYEPKSKSETLLAFNWSLWENDGGGGNCGDFNNCFGSGGGFIGNGDGGFGGDGSNNEECDELKLQNTNPNYKAKVAELDKSSVLSQKHETGYSESKNGTFSSLKTSISTNSSDGLSLPIDANTKGFIHTHQDDYFDGTYDDDGNPRERQPIRMFSPADVNALMEMAQYVNDSNYTQLYGTMISNYGNYTIKFTGTATDIKTGFDTQEWRDAFKTFFEKEKGSLETKFLRFLKEKMGVTGISLYKIKDNGTIQNKTLDTNNKLKSTDCPNI